METIKKILQAHGYTSVHNMDVEDHITVEHATCMDLTIEKIADNRLSVAHYYTQRGDLMSDPEIVFRIDGDEWIPVRFTQHPHVHQHDEDGLSKVKDFVTTWDHNLKRQGFIEAATQRGDG
ncbi:MAG: DUF6908 domain-containing protein [Salinarchaeum sp.]